MANVIKAQEYNDWTDVQWLDFVSEHWLGYDELDRRGDDVVGELYSGGEKLWHHKQLDVLLDYSNLPDKWFEIALFVGDNRLFLETEEQIQIAVAFRLQHIDGAMGVDIDGDKITHWSEYVGRFLHHYAKVFGLPIVEDKPLHLKCDYTPDKLQRLYSLCISQSIIASTTTYETFAYRMAGVGTPTTQKMEWIMQGKRRKGCSKSGLLRFVEKHGKVIIGQDAKSKRIIAEVFGVSPISASTISRIDGEHNQLIDHLLD